MMETRGSLAMRSSTDAVVRAAVGKHPIENLLVQFSVLGLAFMAILGVVLSVILTTRLSREFALLERQAALVTDSTLNKGTAIHATIPTPDRPAASEEVQRATFVMGNQASRASG